MATKTRIYTVERIDGSGPVRLVRATRQGPALAHVAQTTYKAHPATQNDLEQYLGKTKIEEAGEIPDGDSGQQNLPT